MTEAIGAEDRSQRIDKSALQGKVSHLSSLLNQCVREVEKSIIGNQEIIKKLLVAILSEGHVLVEGVPGIAKTKTVVCLARTLSMASNRVQCTPDLLPSDITGMSIFRPDTGQFEIHKGPVFTNILIADEINRTPPKVQAALLESMAERQVTIFGTTEKLKRPFFVMATQNPIEQEGTYPLPEAQLDRFMCKLLMKPLGLEEEKQIIAQASSGRGEHEHTSVSICDQSVVEEAIETASMIYVDPLVADYIARIILATRDEKHQEQAKVASMIRLGASPRASLALLQGARAHALLEGRTFVTPHDVKYLVHDVLRHRIIIAFEAEAQGVTSEQAVDAILSHVPAP